MTWWMIAVVAIVSLITFWGLWYTHIDEQGATRVLTRFKQYVNPWQWRQGDPLVIESKDDLGVQEYSLGAMVDQLSPKTLIESLYQLLAKRMGQGVGYHLAWRNEGFEVVFKANRTTPFQLRLSYLPKEHVVKQLNAHPDALLNETLLPAFFTKVSSDPFIFKLITDIYEVMEDNDVIFYEPKDCAFDADIIAINQDNYDGFLLKLEPSYLAKIMF